MKNIVIIVLIVFFFSASHSCTYPHSINPRLESIYRIAEYEPEIARKLLTEISDSIGVLSFENRMYYDFLKIRVQDKLYIHHESDSSILKILKYYEDTENKHMLGIVLYYCGRVYSDLGDAPQALGYFQKSLDEAKDSRDEKLQGLIYSQMGQLYQEQHMSDLALDAFNKSYQYSHNNNDSIAMIYDMLEIGRIYIQKENYDSALLVYNGAEIVAQAIGSLKYLDMIYKQKASAYMYKGDYDDGIKVLEKLSSVSPENYDNVYYVLKALYYWNRYNRDSTVHYANILIGSGTLSNKMTSHARLAWVAIGDNRPKDAIKHLDSYVILRDSVEKFGNAESVRRINAVYNYELRERDNQKLKMESKYKSSIIIMLSIVMFLVIVLLIVIWRYSVYRNAKIKLKLKAVNELKNELHKRSDDYINECIKKISDLDGRLNDASRLNEQMKIELEHQREMLNSDVIKAKEVIKYKKYVLKKIENSDLMTKVRQLLQSGGNINRSEEIWKEIIIEIKNSFPDFLSAIDNLDCGISDFERQISILIKLGMSPSDIAHLTCHSKEAISSVRRRLYKKVFNETGSPKQWDEFILSL